MELNPPTDQRIVNEYFHLAASKGLKNVAWLYGMVATYGIKPDKLWDFHWGPDNSILLKNRKTLQILSQKIFFNDFKHIFL